MNSTSNDIRNRPSTASITDPPVSTKCEHFLVS